MEVAMPKSYLAFRSELNPFWPLAAKSLWSRGRHDPPLHPFSCLLLQLCVVI